MSIVEYSEAEHLLFKHFGVDHLTETTYPWGIYAVCLHQAFVYNYKYDLYYVESLKDILRAMDEKPCRMTPEFDAIIMKNINLSKTLDERVLAFAHNE